MFYNTQSVTVSWVNAILNYDLKRRNIKLLTKDDPVYYKLKLQKLLKDAKDNNISVEIKNNEEIYFFDQQTGEIASVTP